MRCTILLILINTYTPRRCSGRACSIIGRDRLKSLKQVETARDRCELHWSSEGETVEDYQLKGLARVTVDVARLRTLTAEKQSGPSMGQNL